MNNDELAFFTAQELIDELMRRKTFLGVVVHSDTEAKDPHWGDLRMFKVHFNANLSAGQATRLLDAVASRLEREAW